jgi:hypothetical protein
LAPNAWLLSIDGGHEPGVWANLEIELLQTRCRRLDDCSAWPSKTLKPVLLTREDDDQRRQAGELARQEDPLEDIWLAGDGQHFGVRDPSNDLTEDILLVPRHC